MQSLGISLGSAALLFVFDFLSDHEGTGPTTDQFIKELIEAFAVLIGFSWEKTFNLGIEDMAIYLKKTNYFDRSYVVKLSACIALVAIVLPAYRMYVCPMVFKLVEEKEKTGLSAMVEGEPAGTQIEFAEKGKKEDPDKL